ncbi:hypothetical protein N9D37_00585 [Erythrobacter sp.]|nr:hypothetical protein [Erythrobacter sp.]
MGPFVESPLLGGGQHSFNVRDWGGKRTCVAVTKRIGNDTPV